MVQASKQIVAERLLVEILTKNAADPQRASLGMRYYDLYGSMKKEIGSQHTYEKYLLELEKDHVIERIVDAEDARAKRIRLVNPRAQSTLVLLDALETIQKILAGTDTDAKRTRWRELEGLDADRHELSRSDQRAYVIEMKRSFDLFAVVYKMACEQLTQHRTYSQPLKPGEVYLGAFEGEIVKGVKGRGIGAVSEKRIKLFERMEGLLDIIFLAANDHPELMTSLQKYLGQKIQERYDKLELEQENTPF